MGTRETKVSVQSTTGIPRAFLQASGVGKPKVLVDWLLPYRAQVWLGGRKHSSRNTPVTCQPEEIGGRKAGNLSGAEPLDPRKALLTRTYLTPHRLLLCPASAVVCPLAEGRCLWQWSSDLEGIRITRKGLLKHIARPHSRVSSSA